MDSHEDKNLGPEKFTISHARKVVELISEINNEKLCGDAPTPLKPGKRVSIMIIVPYRRQINKIREMIGTLLQAAEMDPDQVDDEDYSPDEDEPAEETEDELITDVEPTYAASN